MRKVLRNYVPRPVGDLLRRTQNVIPDLHDVIDSLTGRRDPLMPPRRTFSAVGNSDFRKTGEEFFGYFTKFGLKPQHNVLDVGCGIGRMAIPLTRFLVGRYEGFDIVPSEIEWCSHKITPKYPNFRFQLADVFNDGYNPHGKVAGSEYRFPYDDQSFDFCFLTSVFTHMLPMEISNYLRQIRRVLKPSGICVTTWFLLNNESESLISRGESTLKFSYTLNRCKVVDPDVPTNAIAYPELDARAMVADVGLTVLSGHYGSWCGRKEFLSYQDILLLQRA